MSLIMRIVGFKNLMMLLLITRSSMCYKLSHTGGLICAFAVTAKCCGTAGCLKITKKLCKIIKHDDIPETSKANLLRASRMIFFVEELLDYAKTTVLFLIPFVAQCYFILGLRLATSIFYAELIMILVGTFVINNHLKPALCKIVMTN